MIQPFEAPRAKLERARKHLQELRAAVAAYFAQKPCWIEVAQYFDLKDHRAWMARVPIPPPITLATIIGDVVHNLRSALDLLVCDLVRVAGKGTDKVLFPFCESPQHLQKAVRDRGIYRAGPDIARAVESLQPYRGGYILLRCIHDMDIADKHLALLPTIGGVNVPLGKILGGAPANLQEWQALIVDGHMVIGLAPGMSNLPLGTEIPARFFLCFDGVEGDAYRGHEVIEFLEKLTQVVDGIIQALASLRPGATFPSPGP